MYALGWNNGIDVDDLFTEELPYYVFYEEVTGDISSFKVRLDLDQFWYTHVLAVAKGEDSTQTDMITIDARIQVRDHAG
jgi:hypothetical protein